MAFTRLSELQICSWDGMNVHQQKLHVHDQELNRAHDTNKENEWKVFIISTEISTDACH
jgi:hypothetical protein